MSDETSAIVYSFDVWDDLIHMLAPDILLGKLNCEFIFTQGNYAYQIKGGKDGYLCYKKGYGYNWVLIANWCFYGLYMVIRYREPLWLRPMYQHLFTQMNFVSVSFDDYSIELVGTNGEILRSRRFRLSPPCAFKEVMTEKFGFSQQEAENLKVKFGDC
jgi:hypothetical protein